MYRKIMVPLDGSKTAECVLGHASNIAKGCRVPDIILLSVAEPLPSGLYQNAQEVRGKLQDWIKTYLAGVEKGLAKDGIPAKSMSEKLKIRYQIRDDLALTLPSPNRQKPLHFRVNTHSLLRVFGFYLTSQTSFQPPIFSAVHGILRALEVTPDSLIAMFHPSTSVLPLPIPSQAYS